MDPAEITALVNTGDDMVLHGLHISPDVDTVTYTLAGLDNRQTGWGLAGETWSAMEALEALCGQAWFRLGDRDLATHLYRTQRLSEGASLSEVTAELASARGVAVRLVPISDDPVRTRLTLAEHRGGGTAPSAGDERAPTGSDGPEPVEVPFQHYFVRLGHAVPVRAVRFEGAGAAKPAPGVLEAIATATRLVVCPSNPLVSIGPLLAVPGVRDALVARRHDVVAVSPIVAGAALKGPADRLLTELGHESSAVGVARLYSPWAGTLVIDEADAGLAPEVEAEGVRCVVAPTVMSSPERAAALGRVVLDAGR
jgi:LPPG:FO 2-phospho-L-lactate transferase